MKEGGQELFGAIEAGGTKFVCAVGTGDGKVIEEVVVATGDPGETWLDVSAAFDGLRERHGEISGLGVGTFGPVMVDREAMNYGVVLNSPKVAWRGFDFVSAVKNHFGNDLPVVVETDVNAAAFAESEVEKNRGLNSLVYVTVGTGIGGGVIADGKIWHGMGHPEMGHLMVPESLLEPVVGFSNCLFHAACVEGKASGSAMKERWGIDPIDLPKGHEGWDLEAEYLASLAVSLTAAFSPDRIIWGGGVMKHAPLLPMIREKFSALAGGYWDHPDLERYLVKTALNDRAGLCGALALISRAYDDR